MKQSINMRGRGVKVLVLLIIFLITIFSTNATTYDVVSNANEWYICDATGDAPQLGELDEANKIPEYGTFAPTYENDMTTCVEFFNDMYSNLIPEDFERDFFTTCDPDNNWCCDDQTVHLSEILNTCLNHCYSTYGNTFRNFSPDVLCENFGLNCPDDDTEYEFGGEFPKDLCGRWLSCFNSMYSYNPDNGCENQGPGGEVCEGETPYCSNGIIVDALYVDEPEVCCVGQGAQCISFDEHMSCEASGGFLCNDETECTGQSVGNCCFGGFCYGFEFPEIANYNNTFLCYAESGNSVFSECCYEGKCYNEEFLNTGKYVVRGSSTHSIKNYDKVENGVVKDNIYLATLNGLTPIQINVPNYINNWQNYDYLDFIFASNDFNAFTTLVLEFKDNTELELGNFSDFLTLDLGNGFRWNHVSVNLTGITTLNTKLVYKIIINFKEGVSDVQVAYDNVKLIESGDSEGYNSQNRYCSGGFGIFLEDLDYSENPDIALNAELFDRQPYAYACDVQMAFDWTGHFCCGDDTTRENYGEYFSDNLNGCFRGVSIPSDWTVANATNNYNETNNALLFYEGNFWVCDSDDYYGQLDQLEYSYNGFTQAGQLIPPENVVTLFQDKGSWYCDPDGWIYLKDANRMRILAATLKDLGGDNYSLHCGPANKIMNMPLGPYKGERELTVADDNGVCVLNNRSNGKIIVGVPVDKDNIQSFLDNDLSFFHPYNDYDINSVCDNFEEFTNESFYQPCTVGSVYLKLNYNEPFGILLLSFDLSPAPTGFFSFLLDFWNSIVNFFQSLFNIEDNPPNISIPKDYQDAAFEELFINKVGDKLVKGLREENTIVVIYEGFAENVNIEFYKNLTNKWFENNGYDEDYYNIEYVGNATEKSIRINGTAVNDFNLNYLTSNIRLI